jgi:glycosyltransferase involved in cell wall biosynthesis
MSAVRGRMRVLLLQHAIYPYRRPLFDELAKTLDLTVVFCVRSKAFRRWDTSRALVDPQFKPLVLPHIRVGPVVLTRGLLRLLRQDRFDVIVIGVIDFITLPQVCLLLLWSWLQRIPLVTCEEFFPTRWYMESRPTIARVAVAMRRFVYRRSSAFATWNPKARDFLVSCGIEESRIFFGPHFYPPTEGTPGPSASGSAPTFVTIAYFLPRKGLLTLVRVFKRIEGDVLLMIAGSGEQEDELRAAGADDPRIQFVGHLDAGPKRSLLASAYAFVLPTLWDPWGLVVNEALYEGVPVVVTDAAGVSPCLAKAGLVVPAGDEQALYDALRLLLEDRLLRDSMAETARSIVAQWTVGAQAQPLLDAIRLALTSVAPTSSSIE